VVPTSGNPPAADPRRQELCCSLCFLGIVILEYNTGIYYIIYCIVLFSILLVINVFNITCLITQYLLNRKMKTKNILEAIKAYHEDVGTFDLHLETDERDQSGGKKIVRLSS
jgi:hypothetical protein